VGPGQACSRKGRTAQVDYWTLAELRYQIRRFLRLREVAARRAGVEPQRYLLLLQVKGLAGRQSPTIGVLAERLQLRHNSVVELVDRLVTLGMVARRRDGSDRREVCVVLRPEGEAALKRLALFSLRELRTEGPALMLALNRLVGSGRGAGRQRGRAGRLLRGHLRKGRAHA
jgi:DNA-binding MarR family transcriptional regulator